MEHPQHTSIAHRTLLVVDPTNTDGESALDLLDPGDVHVSLVVLLSGRSSAALHEYAAAEAMSMSDAGWRYLEQVSERLDHTNRLVELVVATGPSLFLELTALLAELQPVRRVLLPSSLVRVDPTMLAQIQRTLPVPITTAPATTIDA